MAKIALEHGATIDKYIGDAILAFFGDPETRGVKEDAIACVSMAIAMQRRMRELQAEWREAGLEKPVPAADRHQHGLLHRRQFRQRGPDGLHDHRQRGEPRLPAAGACRAGSILMSHETCSLVRDAVLAEECSPIQAKGFSRPIRNYRVVDPLGEREPEARLIHEEREGLRIVADLQKLDRASAVEALRALIARLGG